MRRGRERLRVRTRGDRPLHPGVVDAHPVCSARPDAGRAGGASSRPSGRPVRRVRGCARDAPGGVRRGSGRWGGGPGGDRKRVRDRLVRDRPPRERRALSRFPDVRRARRGLFARRGGGRPVDNLRHADRRIPRAGDRARRAAAAERAEEPVRRARVARAAHARRGDLRCRSNTGRACGRAIAGRAGRAASNALATDEAALRAGREPPRPLTRRGRLAAHLPHRDRGARPPGGDRRPRYGRQQRGDDRGSGGPAGGRRRSGVRAHPLEPARKRPAARVAAIPRLCREHTR